MTEARQLHGGKLAAKALKRAGVECIFTLSGGHIMPLYDGCFDEGIQIVDVRHEQAAVHAADAWARCHPGGFGVAAITAGPGSPTASPASRTPGARTRRSSSSAARVPSRPCAAAHSRRWIISASSARSRSSATRSTRRSESPNTSSSRSAMPSPVECPDVFNRTLARFLASWR